MKWKDIKNDKPIIFKRLTEKAFKYKNTQKRSKKNPLTKADKKENQRISSSRVTVKMLFPQ